jgi:hypothetical protein
VTQANVITTGSIPVMAQTQPAEKLHAACDECRKPLDPGPM